MLEINKKGNAPNMVHNALRTTSEGIEYALGKTVGALRRKQNETNNHKSFFNKQCGEATSQLRPPSVPAAEVVQA